MLTNEPILTNRCSNTGPLAIHIFRTCARHNHGGYSCNTQGPYAKQEINSTRTHSCGLRHRMLWNTSFATDITHGKNETLNQCWLNVRRTSQTLAQHLTNIGSTPRVCLALAVVGFAEVMKYSDFPCGIMQARLETYGGETLTTL